MPTIKKTLVRFTGVFALMAAVFFLSAHGAQAGFLDGIALMGDFVSGILNVVLYLIIQALGFFLAGIGMLADTIMKPTPITTNTVVQHAWGITRDFANMFFILILLGIALDFILFNSFQIKRMIPKLILVALLINFSLPLAGVVIDFANVFTQFFLSQASDPTTGFTGALAQRLSLSHILDGVAKNGTGSLSNLYLSQNNLLLNLLFAIFFMFGTAFVFLVLALMFIVRTGYLYVLLITLPIVLVLSAFPPTAGRFKEWSGKFVHWVMFAPIATFFLYFAIIMFDGLVGENIQKQLSGQLNQQGFTDNLYSYVIVWVFILGALGAAQSMGGSASKIALDVANKTSRWTRGKLSSAGRTGLTAAGRGLKADERMESVAGGLQKMGLGMLASGVRGVGVKTKMAMQKQEDLTAAEKAKYEGMSDNARMQEQAVWEKSKLPGAGARVAHLAALRAKKGKLNVIDQDTGKIHVAKTEDTIRTAYNAAKTHKNKEAQKAILQSNPIIARKIVREEWERDIAKLAGVTRDASGRLLTGTNKETGKRFEDAQGDVFDISRTDFENMKGMWDGESIGAFMESGNLTRGHLRMASDNGDAHFLTLVGEYYKKIDEMQESPERIAKIAEAKRINPSLTNAYKDGNLTEFGIGKPNNAEDWGGKDKKDAGGK